MLQQESTKTVQFVEIRQYGKDRLTVGGVTVFVQHLPSREGRAPQLRYTALDKDGNILPVTLQKL